MQLYGQLNPGKPVPSFPTLLGNLIKSDGVLSIYKGVDAAIGRQMVYGTARIGLHRTFSDMLVQRNEGKPINFLTKTLSGMASGSIAVCIGTPFDIALVRLQADSMAPVAERRNYKHVFDVSFERPRRELCYWQQPQCVHTCFAFPLTDNFSMEILIDSWDFLGVHPNNERRRNRCSLQRTRAQYLERNVNERWYACMLRSSKRDSCKSSK
jgi:hypothetical protein